MSTEHKKYVKVATYQRSKGNNAHNGDSYFYQEYDNRFVCAIADGLGSGQLAKESSQAVIDVIEQYPNATPDELVRLCNQTLTGKRGVVLGILELDYISNTYAFWSIGNIEMIVVNKAGEKKRLIPKSGYLAGYKCTFKIERGTLNNIRNFVMFSDGVLERELTKSYILDEDVSRIVSYYEELNKDGRKDDTTLIAIRYDENQFE